MEWIDGVKLTDKPKMDAAGLDIIDFVDIGIECTLRQLLEHGYFHADPHPGKSCVPKLCSVAWNHAGLLGIMQGCLESCRVCVRKWQPDMILAYWHCISGSAFIRN